MQQLMGRNYVVEDMVPIVSIPVTTEEYEVVFPSKVTVGLKKHHCTQMTYVFNDSSEESGSSSSSNNNNQVRILLLLLLLLLLLG